jgi:hypothetical protein
MRLGIILPNTVGSYTNSSGGLRTCAVNRRPTRGRQRRSKVHGTARAQPTCAHCDGASFISKHDGGAARATGPAGALLRTCAVNRASNTRKGRSKIHAARRVLSPQCDWGIIYFQTRWRQRFTEIPLARRGALLAPVTNIRRPGRETQRKLIFCPARAQPTRARRAALYFQTRWGSDTEISQRRGSIRSCAANRASNTRKEGSLENSCKTPCDRVIYFKHDGGSATQKFSGRTGNSLRVSKSGVQHEEGSLENSCAYITPQCDWASFISKHDGGSATQKFLWPGVGRSLAVRSNRASTRGGSVARKFMRPSAYSLLKCDWGVISKLDGAALYTILWPGVGRSALVLSKSGVREGRVLKTHAVQASQPACDSGNALYLNTMEQRYGNSSARRGALLALVRSKSGVNEGRSLENSCGPARLSPHAPLRLGRHLISNTMEQRYTEVSPARLGRSLCSCAANRTSNTRKEGRSKIRAAQRARPRPCAFGHHLCQTRWRQRYTEIPLARRGLRTCAVNPASNAAASLGNSCGSARAQPTCASGGASVISNTMEQRYEISRRLRALASCAANRASNTRKEGSARKFMRPGACSTPRPMRLGHLFPNTMEQRYTKFLRPGVGRSCARAQ